MLLDRVRQFIRQHALFSPETRVVVALSGGSDSVALAVILRELDAAGEVRLVGAAHLNHRLSADAERDEAFSASIAAALGVAFVAECDDVRARTIREHRSIEDAARTARYEFFDRARRHFNAEAVALGHTRDDQAETFLLRLVRGAGPRGLAAIYPRHGPIVRPLLDCRRAELRALLQKRGVAFIEDETNGDVAIPRNRVRAELLPALAARFNPAIVDVLAREAELARETWAWLESAADEFDGSGAVEGSCVSSARVLDVEKLKNGPPPLRRLVLWRAMNEAASGRPVAFTHVDAALRLLDTTGGAIDAPGHRVERNGSVLVLTSTPAVRSGAETAHSFQYPLAIPGEVQLAEAACIVAVEVEPPPGAAPDAARSGRGTVALVRRDLCAESLAVRNRRPGDRFRPVGLAGCKKLQDYFVDRKVARKCRDRVPLVVDESDRIVWVAGYGIDEAFRVTEPSQAMLLLRLTQV